MAIPRWYPSTGYTKQEGALLRRLERVRKLFAFLRNHRATIFDDSFQAELEMMYRDTGAGKEPVAPALMAMGTLLQGYLGVSDAEMVELTVVDLRCQMVLDRLGAQEPAFSQGAFFDFRQRLIHSDMDRRLLERTAEVARLTKAFDWKKLPKSLRVAFDSSPLEGAGRVEDTINLLGHAARNVVRCAATLLDWTEEKVAQAAGVPIVLESSVKKALDVNWGNPSEKSEALDRLVRQIDSLEKWIAQQLPEEMKRPPLKGPVETLRQVRAQDLEPDPSGGGCRIRDGVAHERRISIEDGEMRHGRKSKTKAFNGFKRHIACDLDTTLILACAVTPANRPEEEAGPMLKADIDRWQRTIVELHIDRGYVSSPTVAHVLAGGGDVISRAWVARNGDLFAKTDFKLNLRDFTITCPAGEVERFSLGSQVRFSAEACDRCELRAACTNAARGVGRSVSIAPDEKLQQRFRRRATSPRGRAKLRERVDIEHSLAHVHQKQGRRARYRGVRNNLYDLRRAATINNLETVHRVIEQREAA